MKFSEKVFMPLLVAFLTPLITAIASKVKTGDWMGFFKSIPSIYYYSFIILILVWFGITLIWKRIQKIKEDNAPPGVFFFTTPMYGYINIAEINCFNVKWKIKVPSPGPYESFNLRSISPDDIEIDTPPRCPNCGTKLKERKIFWGIYTWDCVKCGFRERNRDSYFIVEDKVKRIAERHYELELSKKNAG